MPLPIRNDDLDTAVIIGGGPSLTQEQVTYLINTSTYIIAVNNAYQLAPFADMIFACDIQWWYYHKNLLKFSHGCWTLEGVGSHFAKRHKTPVLNEIPFTRDYGIYDDKVHHGGNSGYMAIQLARLMGFKKIVLIGFDHQHTNGQTHWHGDHDKRIFNKNADDLDRWNSNMERLLTDITDVDIVNCSLETAITACRRSTLELEIGDLKW